MTSTPTPVDDNRLNMNDESMYKAIDKAMGNSEQTYEEFLKSFTHLKKTDTGRQSLNFVKPIGPNMKTFWS